MTASPHVAHYNAITDVPGLEVGHAQDERALTGCTVVLCRGGAVAGVDVRGGAPGTRETDALHPMHLVQQAHAIVLSGGSAFGLDAASGVMRYLESQGIGFDAAVVRVPIVPAAVLFDLAIGDPAVRPDAGMGFAACLNAVAGPVTEGNVGAGCGATVGKILGMNYAMKSGLGTASIRLQDGLVVGAIVAVNALGSVVDPQTGCIIAGPRDPESGRPIDTLELIKAGTSTQVLSFGNTTIGVVGTNARLTKEGVNKMASMAHNGLAVAIRPAHTWYDGDTVFALSTGEIPADLTVVGALAAEAMVQAIVRGARAAQGAGGLPACCDLI